MKKVLHLIPKFDLITGGPVRAIEALAEASFEAALSKHTVLVSNDPLDILGSAPGLEVAFWGTEYTQYNLSFSLLKKLHRYVPQSDLVVIHCLWRFHVLATALLCMWHKKPYVIFSHSSLDIWYKKSWPLKHFKKLCVWLLGEGWAVSRSQGVIFTSDQELSSSQKTFPFYKFKSHLLTLGVKKIKESTSTPTELSQLNEKPLLFLSRIHPKKGLDLLFESFAKLIEEQKNLKLFIAGSGNKDYQAKLKELCSHLGISNNVVWLGHVEGERKAALFKHSQLFVLPTHQENFGIAIAEALSCGLPVLITNKADIWPPIQRHKAGLIAAPNVMSVTENLKTWFDLSSSDKKEMSENARLCFDRHFSMKTYAKNFDDIVKIVTNS